MLGFRGTPLRRALVVLAATLLVLIMSAIVLPPKGTQARPAQGDEAPVIAPH
jgi:hypothetical protein